MTALPPTLDRFGAELENAVRRDLGARRRRRWMLRAAALSAAAAAAAFGLLSALPTGGPSVVERAAAALVPPDDTILHYQLSGEQRNPDGSVVTWRSESWDLRAAPFTGRQIEVGPDGIRAETLTRGDLNELYDARTNTIYVASRQELVAARMPKIKIVSTSEIAKITRDPRVDTALVLGKGGKHPIVVTTEQGAKRLREQLAQGLPTGSRSTSSTRRPMLPSSGPARGMAEASRSASRSTRSYPWIPSRCSSSTSKPSTPGRASFAVPPPTRRPRPGSSRTGSGSRRSSSSRFDTWAQSLALSRSRSGYNERPKVLTNSLRRPDAGLHSA